MNYFFFFKGTKNNVDQLKHFVFTNNTNGLNSNQIINEKSKFDYEDFNNKKLTFLTTNTNHDDHRTILAHHIFHANIKQTLTRWIRETPV